MRFTTQTSTGKIKPVPAVYSCILFLAAFGLFCVVNPFPTPAPPGSDFPAIISDGN